MHIFAYEWITGGGLLEGGEMPRGSLLLQGRAMIAAVARDLAAIGGVEVTVMRDRRLAPDATRCRVVDVEDARGERRWFARLAGEADWTIVIAPETGGALAERCRLVEQSGGRLLGPSPYFVELAGDKRRTSRHLAAAGIATGRLIEPDAGGVLPGGGPLPVVIKPVDGAGSRGVRLIRQLGQLPPRIEPDVLVEQYVPGRAVSVAFLCGPVERLALPPCGQHLSDDGRFAYLGGSSPLPSPLARRAAHLARRAVESLPAARGHVGVDLVLGEAEDGGGDVVIEINPRLTTSYVGLRLLTDGNLAAAMLDVAAGRRTALSFGRGRITFDAGGNVVSQGVPAEV